MAATRFADQRRRRDARRTSAEVSPARRSMARGVPEATPFSLWGRKARCCQKPGSWERQAPLPGLVCMALCFRRGSSQVWKSWFDESFGTKLLTGASLLMNLIPSFRCVDGQEFGRFWRSQEIDRDQSEHDSLSRLFLAFERSRSDEDWLRWMMVKQEPFSRFEGGTGQGVIIHGQMA